MGENKIFVESCQQSRNSYHCFAARICRILAFDHREQEEVSFIKLRVQKRVGTIKVYHCKDFLFILHLIPQRI